MSVVIPFGQCKARPDEGGHQFWLESHLVAVAQGWGKVDGSYNERLCFLGGLCHDAAKGRKKWQDNLLGPKGSRPPHAAPGALCFLLCSQLLDLWKSRTDWIGIRCRFKGVCRSGSTDIYDIIVN